MDLSDSHTFELFLEVYGTLPRAGPLKDRVGRLRIVQRLDRLASGNPGDAKPLERGIWELRLMFGPGYRIYYLREVRA